MLKQLASWRGSRILALWVLLALTEGSLFLVNHLSERRSEDGAPLGHTLNIQSGAQLSEAGRDSLAALMLVATRPLDSAAEARRATILAALGRPNPPVTSAERDSLLRLLDVPATLTIAQRDSAARAVGALFAPMVGLVGQLNRDPSWRWLIAGAVALIYAPPALLMVITLSWLVARRRFTSRRSRQLVA